MNFFEEYRREQLALQTRRSFLRSTGSLSLGAIALQSLAGQNGHAALLADNPLASRTPHFTPRAKRMIYLHMSGGPPNLDIFDYKPELVKRSGQECPDEFLKGRRFA